MKKLYIPFLLLLICSFLSANAYSTIQLNDSTIQKLVELNNFDDLTINTLIKNNEDLNQTNAENLKSILNLLHQNIDTAYSNNIKTYSISKNIVHNYIEQYPETLSFCKNIANSNNEYLEYNIETYLTRLFFQLFYEKGSQYILERTDIQESMKPNITEQMFEKTIDKNKFTNDLKFIAKNSKYKLYNL